MLGVHVVIITCQLILQDGTDINKIGRNLEEYFNELILDLPKDTCDAADRKTQVFKCIFLLKTLIVKSKRKIFKILLIIIAIDLKVSSFKTIINVCFTSFNRMQIKQKAIAYECNFSYINT